MADLDDLIEKHFRALEASAPVPGFGRYLRPVMLGSAHLVLARGIREAYDQGRLDAALAIHEAWTEVNGGRKKNFGQVRLRP